MVTAITTIDPRIRNSNSVQANLQLERSFGTASTLAVGYQYLRGLHLILSRNLNVPALTAAEADQLGVANLGRPDPRFANINQYEGAGDSYYSGMTVAFSHQAWRGLALRASYTLSKAIDNAGNFFFSSPQNNFDLRDDRGLSDNDQRHRFVLSGVYTTSARRPLLAGWQLSYIVSYTSALPFNIQTGTDRNNDTNVNDRPAGVGRNTGRGFSAASLDTRLSRSFRLRDRVTLEVMAEAFNTMNRVNRQVPNNIFGPGLAPLPSFGRATSAGDARQAQLGVRVSW
jgi:hypothetical protein